jgi:hypothetical protein
MLGVYAPGDAVRLVAGPDGARVMLAAGKPIREPIVLGRPLRDDDTKPMCTRQLWTISKDGSARRWTDKILRAGQTTPYNLYGNCTIYSLLNRFLLTLKLCFRTMSAHGHAQSQK